MEAALEMEGPWKNPDQDVPFPDGIKFRMKCKNSDDTDTPFYLHGLLHLKKYKSDQYIPVVPIQSLHLWAPVEYTQANPDWMERKLCTEPEQSSDKSATGAGAKPTLKKVTLEEAKSIFQRMNNARTSKSTIWEENWDLWKQTLPLTPVERLVKNGVGNNPKRVMELLLPTQTPDSNNMNLQYVENNQFISKTVQWRKITTSDGGSFSEQIKRSGEEGIPIEIKHATDKDWSRFDICFDEEDEEYVLKNKDVRKSIGSKNIEKLLDTVQQKWQKFPNPDNEPAIFGKRLATIRCLTIASQNTLL